MFERSHRRREIRLDNENHLEVVDSDDQRKRRFNIQG